MKEILPGLYLGSSIDVAAWEGPLLFATKTWHKLFVGYESHKAPRPMAEYLFAVRDGRMALNMVDGTKPNKLMVDVGLQYMEEYHYSTTELLVVCNAGMSRSKYMMLKFLNKYTAMNGPDAFDLIEAETIHPELLVDLKHNWVNK